jgi:hypothetical protein
MYPSQPSRMIVLVAPATDARAKAIAEALRPVGWDAIISADIMPYVQLTRAFAVLLTPTSVQSLPIFTRPQPIPVGLIPVLVEPMELPLANWVTAPLQYDPSSVATTAQAIATIAMKLPAPVPQMPAAPSTPYGGSIPSTPLSASYYSRPPAPTAAFPPGAIIVFIGAVLGVIGFSLPWISVGSYYYSIVSVNGWQLLNAAQLASSSDISSSGTATTVTLVMYLLLLLIALNAGVMIPALAQSKGTEYFKAQPAIAGIGLAVILLGIISFVSQVSSASSYAPSPFSYIGVGVYLTILGFIVAMIGGVQLRRSL